MPPWLFVHFVAAGSDSRVPPNQIVGLPPGSLFVHRNVGNIVSHSVCVIVHPESFVWFTHQPGGPPSCYCLGIIYANLLVFCSTVLLLLPRIVTSSTASQDMSAISAIEFSVKVLKVRHILIVGHDYCGAVTAAMNDQRVGAIDHWLAHIRDVRRRHAVQLSKIEDYDARRDRLVQLNVLEQVHNTCAMSVVQSAWNDGQPLSVHGWMYRLSDGLVRDLGFRVDGPGEIDTVYRTVAPPPKAVPKAMGVLAEV